MKDRLKTGFADRIEAQREAKKALLAKFQAKPHVPDPDFVSREERKRQELDAVRQARADAKEAARLAAEAAEKARKEDMARRLEEDDELRRSLRKERKAQTKADQRARREAKKRK
jgi:hypothetical protein